MERTALRRPLGSPTPASGAVSDSSQRLGEIYLTFKTRNGLGRTRRQRVPTRCNLLPPGPRGYYLPPGMNAPGHVVALPLPAATMRRPLLRSMPACQQFPRATLGVASGFLYVTRFESDLGAVDFAIDLVIAVDEANILGLGAALERTGAAAQLEILDEDDGVAVGQDRTVGILDDTWAVGSRSALP